MDTLIQYIFALLQFVKARFGTPYQLRTTTQIFDERTNTIPISSLGDGKCKAYAISNIGGVGNDVVLFDTKRLIGVDLTTTTPVEFVNGGFDEKYFLQDDVPISFPSGTGRVEVTISTLVKDENNR